MNSPPLNDSPKRKNENTNTIPWIEKYRPKNFESIVLDPVNRRFFNKILEKKYFPNLIFYGTPGTGKTTTIINLINEYQKKYNNSAKGAVIHLNASDERGIDIIRNQINQFVKSKNMFESSCKFVILDEVDHMTKNAQQALKYLIQTSNYNVHYCLICNYISKIDEPLQQEFICVRFNQLPKKEILQFIKYISNNENIDLDYEKIETIQEIYKSDIRSIINFIQLNQDFSERSVDKLENSQCENLHWTNSIITYKTWVKLHSLLSEGFPDKRSSESIKFIYKISSQYNIDKMNIINKYFNYIIKNTNVTPKLLSIIETIVHSEKTPVHIVVQYFATFVSKYYQEHPIPLIRSTHEKNLFHSPATKN
jgi:replication factor C subunit 3/5